MEVAVHLELGADCYATTWRCAARSPAALSGAATVRRMATMSAVRKLATRSDHESIVARLDPRQKNVVSGPSGW